MALKVLPSLGEPISIYTLENSFNELVRTSEVGSTIKTQATFNHVPKNEETDEMQCFPLLTKEWH